MRGVTDLLLEVLPLALGAAVSPTVLIVAVLLLASPSSPRLRATLFLLGAALVLVVLGLVGLTLFSTVTPGGDHRTAWAWIDTIAGVVLVLVALRLLLVKRRTAHEERAQGGDDAASKHRPVWVSFPLGIVMMLTNTSTLALYVPILKDLSRADAGTATTLATLAIVDVIILLPALLPLALTVVAPGPAGRVLGEVRKVATRYARPLSGAIFLVLGVYLAWRGIGEL
jgi:threonine/homoserine/homoserine lactone efflux protein